MRRPFDPLLCAFVAANVNFGQRVEWTRLAGALTSVLAVRPRPLPRCSSA